MSGIEGHLIKLWLGWGEPQSSGSLSQLRSQLASVAALHGSANEAAASTTYKIPSAPPSGGQALLLRQLVASGYIDNLAQRADLSPTPPSSRRSPSSASQVPYVTLFSSKRQELSKSAVEELGKSSNSLAIHAETPLYRRAQLVNIFIMIT